MSKSTFSRYAASCLPTIHGNFDCIVYQVSEGDEAVALVSGVVLGRQNLLCRIQSECLTGEVFGSTKCDCKGQLDLALNVIAKKGGVVIYLRQEGRGIGLGNKIKAYALQEKGFDTLDANRALGLPDDARTYEAAAYILADLGVDSVTLMTNNPTKIIGLRRAGTRVLGRIEHVAPSSPKLATDYLQIKRQRMDHYKSHASDEERPLFAIAANEWI